MTIPPILCGCLREKSSSLERLDDTTDRYDIYRGRAGFHENTRVAFVFWLHNIKAESGGIIAQLSSRSTRPF